MIGETVIRIRPALVENRYGGTDKDWTDPDELTIYGCAVAPRIQTEDTAEGREGVVIGWSIYAPASADVLPTDRVRVRGVDHDVDGQPAEWRSAYTGARLGLEVQLRRVEG